MDDTNGWTVLDLLMRGAGRASVATVDGQRVSGAPFMDPLIEAAEVLSSLGVTSRRPAAIVLPNGPTAALSFLAGTAAGSVAPLNPSLGRHEMASLLDDLEPAVLILAEGAEGFLLDLAAAQGIVPVRAVSGGPLTGFRLLPEGPRSAASGPRPTAADVALLLHTSGTTAKPKLVPLTQRNLAVSASNVASSLQLSDRDTCLNVMPLFHIHGLVACLLAPLIAGGTVICTPGFSAPRVRAWLDDLQPTWYSAVPSMHQSLLAHIATAESSLRVSLRFIRSSSAPLPPSVLARLEDTFGAPVIEAYGMTEAAHQICTNPLPPGRREPGSVGLPAGPEVDILVGGRPAPRGMTGEVVIRGDNVTSGYLASPQANREAFVSGWFRTGDVGRLDDGGYLYLVGRSKEIINRGGEKVSPREVDDVLATHPAVAAAVTFAVPDQQLGEAVAAAVVPREGAVLDVLALRRYCAELLAPFKVPAGIVVVDEVPVGPTGKPRRVGMAQLLGVSSLADIVSGEPVTPSDGGVPVERTAADVEERLSRLWEEVLELKVIGLDDDFVELGGDSILAMQLLAHVREELAPDVDTLTFLDASTVRAQADVIARVPPSDG